MKRRFKFGLIGLFSLIGFSCFCNAGSYTFTGSYNGIPVRNGPLIGFPIVSYNSLPSDISFVCSVSNYTGSDFISADARVTRMTSSNYGASTILKSGIDFTGFFLSGDVLSLSYNYGSSDGSLMGISISFNAGTVVSTSFDWSCTLSGDNIINQSSIGNCSQVNTGDILSGSCDTNYCVENDLCPVPSNFSQLYINDIEHQSAPIIDITIPEEFNWDYTVDSGEFNLGISGYNVDTEYIDGIIRTQTTKPNDTDFNNIVSYLLPLLVPGLVIIFFIWFIFRFIKKIF